MIVALFNGILRCQDNPKDVTRKLTDDRSHVKTQMCVSAAAAVRFFGAVISGVAAARGIERHSGAGEAQALSWECAAAPMLQQAMEPIEAQGRLSGGL